MAISQPSESIIDCCMVNTASEENYSPNTAEAAISCPPPKHLCLPSKAVILILLWTIIVGAIYNIQHVYGAGCCD